MRMCACVQAREFGDFLLVGIHDDEVVNQRWGSHYPIMNLHERALRCGARPLLHVRRITLTWYRPRSVLACKYVDEVIIGCPREITRDMIVSMNINVVVTGTECETKCVSLALLPLVLLLVLLLVLPLALSLALLLLALPLSLVPSPVAIAHPIHHQAL